MPVTFRLFARTSNASTSVVNFFRWIVVTGVASVRSGFDTAMPIVFVPKSRPKSGPEDGKVAMASKKASDIQAVSGIWSGSARLAIIAAGAAVLLLIISLVLRPAPQGIAEVPSYDIRVATLPTENGAEILYRAYTPISEMTLLFPSDQIDRLEIVEGKDKISLKQRGEGVALTGSEAFGLAAIELDYDAAVERDQPVAQVGTSAAVLNMSYFNPVQVNGQAVRDNNSQQLLRWVGAGEPFTNDRIQIFSDIGLPTPVSSLLAPAADQLAGHYANGFGRELSTLPQLMFLFADGNAGQLAVTGEAVASQAVIKYTGGGYLNDTPEMRRLVLFNLAHELVHLWQLEHARVATTTDWLHEGVANALAAEALYISGLWEDDEYLLALETAKNECAAYLGTGTLKGAAGRGHYQAGYACGHMAATALASQREGGTVMSMWRAFSESATQMQGLTDEAFYQFARDWSGSDKFTSSLRSFVISNYKSADRDEVIDRLFAGTL